MAERGSRKIPVTDRQFLWVQDDDKGEVVLHVGPTMVSPTAADRVVVDDGEGAFREDHSGRPQKMIELADSQYAVLYNPLVELDEGTPNGRFKSGRNESRSLRNGTRHMIPGPTSFFLRPGQRVEVRDAHELASNQYLVVKVYGAVDHAAPYYEITAKSATITAATAEDVGDTTTGLSGSARPEIDLTRGQLIVIRGLDTQFYIPPTGVDIVPDLTVGTEGGALSAAAARRILKSTPRSSAQPMPAGAPEHYAPPAELPIAQQAMMPDAELLDALSGASESAYAEELDDEELYEEEARARPRKKQKKRDGRAQRRVAHVEQAARLRHQFPQRSPAAPEPEEDAEPGLSQDEINTLLSSNVHRQALEREVRKSRLVRQAVVLSEKEFCVILDADGKRQIKRGPARVFPGPYDSFTTKGSNDRIYYAYELLPQRALWLRFIAPISRERLEKLVPRGVELDADMYHPGDELILTGVNSFFFPFNEVEILHPLMGQPHVGNDHSDIFIEAIGIDQKSGIYVRDLTTGEARLVRGKQSYLVDPRKEVHITRSVSPDEWNLWIAIGEPHKAAADVVTTPWAISIVVPHNTAVLATSADGQRVIEGPCVELLEYEEKLVPMRLSTGTPKSDDALLETCFLRTVGNQVSDVVNIETADFVKITVRVSYAVAFDKEHRERWFNHDDYVGVLCDHLRSLVRGRARQITLTDLWPRLPDVIRDIILGEKTEDTPRSGRLFDDNGMRVTEVEVLDSEILDKEIAKLLEVVQRESVSLVIGDNQSSEQLRSAKHRYGVEVERLELEQQTRERRATLEEVSRRLAQLARLDGIRNEEAAQREEARLVAERERAMLEAEIGRDKLTVDARVEQRRAEVEVEVESQRMVHEEERAFRDAMAKVQIALLQAESAATVAERAAVQPALVEALTALGDKQLLAEIADNMNLVSLFKGKDVATIFSDIVGGTKLGRTVDKMLPSGNGAGSAEPSSPPPSLEQ